MTGVVDRWGVDDTGCSILHVDMDCFFASCEEKFNPEIVGLPVIVGGLSSRGVVSAANYVARSFGVRSGMPIGKAQVLCPDGVFLNHRLSDYREVSEQVFRIFRNYSDRVEGLSVDEAFIDVSGQGRVLGSPVEIAKCIRRDIRETLGLVASVGVAENMFLAKIASGMSKPDGLLLVSKECSKDFLFPLPVGVIWGLGAKGQKILRNRGFERVGDLHVLSLDELCRLLGDAMGSRVFDLCRGVDMRKVGDSVRDKSISNERTFTSDVFDREVLNNELLFLSRKCGFSLRSKGFVARTVSVKVKFSDFSVVSRDLTLSVPTCDDRSVYDVVLRLMDRVNFHLGVRLIGVRVSGLLSADSGVADVLFDDFVDGDCVVSSSNVEVLRAEDCLREKYGEGIIVPASLLDRFQ